MRFLVLFETVDGHTSRIAHRIGNVLRDRGHAAEVWECRALLDTFSLRSFDGAILGGPIRHGRFPRPLLRFVRENLAALERIPCWFFTVSLAAALPEKGTEEVGRNLERFEALSGWSPQGVAHFAGALTYTRYGALKRFGMRLLARVAGLDTDTSRDHFYTNWPSVRAFALEFCERMEQEGPARLNASAPRMGVKSA